MSDGIAHILKQKTGFVSCNYLDDFLHVANTKEDCNLVLDTFLEICSEIGMPISHEKTERPTQTLTFLGIQLDSQQQRMLVPAEKKFRALDDLDEVINSRKVTVLRLQQLTGLLNFIGRAIVPGRAFTRRMYSKFSNPRLKQHYHITVDRELRQDSIVWKRFLNLTGAVNRPFIDFSKDTTATELNWYTDSSRNTEYGFGCYFSGRYAFALWNDSEQDFILKYEPSINFLELYAIVLSVELWCHLIQNRRVTIFSDNESAVHMINNSSSTCKSCMKLIRILTLTSLRHNTRIFLKHVPGKFNVLSDSLSRDNLPRFLKFAPKHNLAPAPEKLPPTVWPLKPEWFE